MHWIVRDRQTLVREVDAYFRQTERARHFVGRTVKQLVVRRR